MGNGSKGCDRQTDRQTSKGTHISAPWQIKIVDVIYLDFAKAFDKVDIGLTLKELRQHGIGGKLGLWLEAFLTQRVQ